VLLLQIDKCSMSSSIVAWEVPDDFVYFLIFFFACVRASQSHCWISSSHLSMSFLQSDRIIITSSVTTFCASACRNAPFWNNRGRRGWSQGCRMISPQGPTQYQQSSISVLLLFSWMPVLPQAIRVRSCSLIYMFEAKIVSLCQNWEEAETGWASFGKCL